jgi:hypothetical protein
MRNAGRTLVGSSLLGLCFVVACTETMVSPIEIASIEVMPGSAPVAVGGVIQLEAQARDLKGQALRGRNFAWGSSDATIAAVSQDGLVQGRALGEVTIEAVSEGVRGIAHITVVHQPAIHLDPPTVAFSAIVGDPAPPSAVVAITNVGGGALDGLAVATTYAAGAGGWLTAVLSGTVAPATLTLQTSPGGLSPGAYSAIVEVASPVAATSPVRLEVALDVLQRSPAPALSAVDPKTARREETLTLRFQGGNFVDGVTTVDLGSGITVHQVQVQSPTRLDANITIDRSAALGARDVSVRNPPPGGGVATIANGLTIEGENPFPTVSAVQPPSGQRQATMEVVVLGSNYVRETTTADFGPGITINSVTVTSDTSLVANISIGENAELGPRSVSVSNPAPGGGIATRPNAFAVEEANPRPTISSVTPATGRQRETIEVVIAGSNFRSDLTSVSFGAGISVEAVEVASASSIVARIAIAAEAPEGPRAVSVTNAPPGGGTAIMPDAFVVRSANPQPTLNGIEPATARSGSDLAVTVTGSGFVQGVTTLHMGPGVDVTQVQVASPAMLTASLGISGTAAPGPREVRVSNPSPGGGTATLEGGFSVVGSVSGSASSMSASPASGVVADGTQQSTVTVVVRDALGTSIPGVPAGSFAISVTGSAKAGPVAPTGTAGTYAFAVTNTVAETVTVSVDVEGVTLADKPTIGFVAGGVSPTQSSVSAAPVSGVRADGTAASTVTVQLRDASGHPVGGLASGDFAVAVSGSGSAGAVGETGTTGTYTFAVTNIVAEVVEVAVTAGGVALQQTASITFVPGPVAAIDLTGSAEELASGAERELTATLKDSSGNVVTTGDHASLTVTFSQASGSGSVTGLGPAQAAAGVAKLTVTGGAAGPVSLVASTSSPSATSNTLSFDVIGAAATQLSITTQPSATAQSGVPFAQQPVIQLRDGAGNAVAQAGVMVTAAIASGGGSLGGTTTASTDASGVAIFADLSITGEPGQRTLRFSASGLTPATSAPIDVTAASATQLSISTQPSATAQSGVPFAQQPVIQLRDGAGNAVAQAGVSVSVSLATGTGALKGTTTVQTDASGVATFTDLSITGAPGQRTLRFTAPGLTSVTSNAITLGS